ncbi:MAG: hypothetical protein MRY83_01945 [Flavobacteriales bacterium]|nr:hypothetical protein [Flavobacteriales bacterium]
MLSLYAPEVYINHIGEEVMAMVACPECKNEVSDKAFKCPHCAVVLRQAKRGFFGKLFKYGFILFNIIMIYSMYSGMDAATDKMQGMHGAEQTGAAIGTGIGAFMLGVIWVMGDIILGLAVLFTRPKEK